tara:strand:+ start:2358 stop:2783 length:426 start_codon:yes stop_codon:yes gene_type:complete
MNIALSVKDLSIDHIFFLDPIKNIIINNSKFIRIIYSNNLLTLNGIYLICNIDNKDKLNNHGLLLYIQKLEDNILNKFSKEKIKNYKIREYFNNNFINTNYTKGEENYTKYILKISGIWDASNNIGVTFKFLKLDTILSIC